MMPPALAAALMTQEILFLFKKLYIDLKLNKSIVFLSAVIIFGYLFSVNFFRIDFIFYYEVSG